MYYVSVEDGFSALHQLRLPDGTLEPLHGHDWRVTVRCDRPVLDAHGMVVDFEDIRQKLRAVLAPLHHGHLNQHSAFRTTPPTAEVVARWIFEALIASGLTALSCVEVAEAPGCRAGYAP